MPMHDWTRVLAGHGNQRSPSKAEREDRRREGRVREIRAIEKVPVPFFFLLEVVS